MIKSVRIFTKMSQDEEMVTLHQINHIYQTHLINLRHLIHQICCMIFTQPISCNFCNFRNWWKIVSQLPTPSLFPSIPIRFYVTSISTTNILIPVLIGLVIVNPIVCSRQEKGWSRKKLMPEECFAAPLFHTTLVVRMLPLIGTLLTRSPPRSRSQCVSLRFFPGLCWTTIF